MRRLSQMPTMPPVIQSVSPDPFERAYANYTRRAKRLRIMQDTLTAHLREVEFRLEDADDRALERRLAAHRARLTALLRDLEEDLLEVPGAPSVTPTPVRHNRTTVQVPRVRVSDSGTYAWVDPDAAQHPKPGGRYI